MCWSGKERNGSQDDQLVGGEASRLQLAIASLLAAAHADHWMSK